MKYKVLLNFIDKNTGKLYNKGAIYECDKKRFEDIQSKGNFLKEEKQPKKAEVKK